MLTVLSLVLAAEAGSPVVAYQRARVELESRRVELNAAWKKAPAEARQQARTTLISYLEKSAFPAWEGPTWNCGVLPLLVHSSSRAR